MNRLFTVIFGIFFLGFLVFFVNLVFQSPDSSGAARILVLVIAGLMGMAFIWLVLVPAFFKKKSPAWTGME